MSWLQRLFGQEKPAAQQSQPAGGGGGATTQAIPAERIGLRGEYDQSGLAKRVALAFDSIPELAPIDSVFVAQTGSTVVLKGRAPTQELLRRMETVARGVAGATAVDSSQVTVG